jgi:hypothetical protein
MGSEQRATAAILPFRGEPDRRARRAFEPDERRGEILLVTGVRYERAPEPGPTRPSSPAAAGRSGGRRRRS